MSAAQQISLREKPLEARAEASAPIAFPRFGGERKPSAFDPTARRPGAVTETGGRSARASETRPEPPGSGAPRDDTWRLEIAVADLLDRRLRAHDDRIDRLLGRHIAAIDERMKSLDLSGIGQIRDSLLELKQTLHGNILQGGQKAERPSDGTWAGPDAYSISREFADIRLGQQEAERQMQAVLTTVHAALEQVIQRLPPRGARRPEGAAPQAAAGRTRGQHGTEDGASAREAARKAAQVAAPTLQDRSEAAFHDRLLSARAKSSLLDAFKNPALLRTVVPAAAIILALAATAFFASPHIEDLTAFEKPRQVAALAQAEQPQARLPGVAAAPANVAPAAQPAEPEGPLPSYTLAMQTAEGRGGIARDQAEATRLFEKAATAGLAKAQFTLATRYEKGIGAAQDIERAKEWYRRAAEAGHARAMHNLAVLIVEGGGAKPDYRAAAIWFEKAATFGNRDSQYNLAVLLARGLGGSADPIAAYKWFAAAAAQGDRDAAKERDETAAKLSAADLATARAAAERFKAQTPDAAINEV